MSSPYHLLMGMPSMRIVKAIAFFAKDISEVSEGNLALSWFSMNDPRSVVSLQVDFIWLIPLTRLLMLPLVDSNAWVIQKYLSDLLDNENAGRSSQLRTLDSSGHRSCSLDKGRCMMDLH